MIPDVQLDYIGVGISAAFLILGMRAYNYGLRYFGV
jgi:hypothetical protein